MPVAAVGVWAKLAAAGVIGLAAVGTVAGVEAVRAHDTTTEVPMSSAHDRPSRPIVSAPAPRVEPSPNVEPPSATPAPIPPLPVAPKLVAAHPRPQPTTPAPAPTVTAEPGAPWIPEAPSRPKSTLGEELGLLESARGHLARSPETALAKLAEHRARYASGVLADERDLMELDALRRTGRVQDARSRAAAWLARDPQGVHAARVRQISSSIE